jgi:hypothetical protein
MKYLLICLTLLITVQISAQFINKTGDNIEEYVNTIAKEINLPKHIKVTFNNTEGNTSLYVLCDEKHSEYEVYLKETKDKLFYCELIAVSLLRIKELDSETGAVNWKAVLYTSSKLAAKYVHLYH